jgi:Holliday junction resolvase RusA-like endonuclease
MQNAFNKSSFLNGEIKFIAPIKPVSSQNNGVQKRTFRDEIQKITSKSQYIVTGTCWIAIDYYCQHIKRQKYPGVYDMDNIVKPILDALVGMKGLIVDDVLVDRVTVNWIDTAHDDHIEIEIQYPDLLFVKKSELLFVKSDSGWCLPLTCDSNKDDKFLPLIRKYFEVWNSIKSEDDYYNSLCMLPMQPFLYYSKIKDKNYAFVELTKIDNGSLNTTNITINTKENHGE